MCYIEAYDGLQQWIRLMVDPNFLGRLLGIF